MRHLILLGKYEAKKQRREIIEQKLSENKRKQRKQLDKLHGLS